MDETVRFVAEYLSRKVSMSELCRRFGISRQWGYELVHRYETEGLAGLQPRSRAPLEPGRSMPRDVAEAIIALRLREPTWGPKKLKKTLEKHSPQLVWPARSSIGDLLRREGLVATRRRKRHPIPISRPFAPVLAPNDLWCIDFKGWFRTGDGERCDPLTLSDADSRFLLACRAVEPTTQAVDQTTDEAFHEYGLPTTMRSDNGAPFAGTGAGGLSRLAVKWIKLGIRLERTDLASPEQNGRHERMHGTLKAETARPPAASLSEQQLNFDRFRHKYNNVRPHEALDLETPASRYRPSTRAYPERPLEPDYDDSHAARRVRSNGEINWGGDLIFISEVLVGEPVGVVETENGDWIVRFFDYDLGLIDRRTGKLRPFAAPRPGGVPRTRERNGNSVNNVSGP